jgi:hypothetical protein
MCVYSTLQTSLTYRAETRTDRQRELRPQTQDTLLGGADEAIRERI